MKLPKPNIPHLILTIVVTFVSAFLLLLFLVIADSQISNPLEYSESKHLIKIIVIAFIVLTSGTIILIQLYAKTKDKNTAKAFSYKIAILFLGILFLWSIRMPVKRLLINNPTDNKTLNEEIKESEAKIKKFLDEHSATDSITNSQINDLIDTLGIGWNKADTLK